MKSEDARADVRGELMDRAAQLLNEHRPDEFGLCAGCMAWWGRYIPYVECASAKWAVRVIETHGVPESAWLVPTHIPDWLTSVTAGQGGAAVCAARSATYTARTGPTSDVPAAEAKSRAVRGPAGLLARQDARQARRQNLRPQMWADAWQGGERMGKPDEEPGDEGQDTTNTDAEVK